jgi:exodeoxyribonuclease-5
MFTATYYGTCANCERDIHKRDSMGAAGLMKENGDTVEAPVCAERIRDGSVTDLSNHVNEPRQPKIPDLTVEQLDAAAAIASRLEAGEAVIRVGGLAGTGKTTLAAALPRLLRRRITFAAPTGKAAHNLAQRLGQPVSTLHRLMYGAPSGTNGRHLEWTPRASLHAGLICVDEASMVGRRLYDDLLAFGAPIIFIGDHGQLPPISRDSFELMANPDIELRTIHRQAAQSPIVQLAHSVRAGEPLEGEFVRRWTREGIGTPWEDDTLVLCHTNAVRVRVNQKARIGKPDHPVAGDSVVCLRNDYRKGVFNGQTGTVEKYDPRRHLMRVVLDNGESYLNHVSAEQFNAPDTLWKTDLSIGLWDYAYAQTVHKAQGSESDRVMVLVEAGVKRNRRWQYTAITRAKKHVEILVDPR